MLHHTRPETSLAVQGMTQRYRRRGPDVLCDLNFAIPTGVVCAVVGPNGAGKSTLLELAAGLQRPAAGTLEVLGGAPRAGHPNVAYLAQDRPLFSLFTVTETLRMGARLNPATWDQDLAEQAAGLTRTAGSKRISELSGGQRTRIALALALGKRADLLLLDEPMADLDVLARQELMGLLMAYVMETGATVMMSSHIISELADACDHLLLLDEGTSRLCGDIDELKAAHAVVTLPNGADQLTGHTIIEARPAGRGTSALLRPHGPLPAEWEARHPSLEELVVAHLTSRTLRPVKDSAA